MSGTDGSKSPLDKMAFSKLTILLNTLLIHPIKGKVTPLHAMEALGVRGGIAATHS
jgi:hypothetical protein